MLSLTDRAGIPIAFTPMYSIGAEDGVDPNHKLAFFQISTLAYRYKPRCNDIDIKGGKF